MKQQRLLKPNTLYWQLMHLHDTVISYLICIYNHIPTDVPTFSNEIAFRIVEEELNQKFGDVFELVEPEPVAGMYPCLELLCLRMQVFYGCPA